MVAQWEVKCKGCILEVHFHDQAPVQDIWYNPLLVRMHTGILQVVLRRLSNAFDSRARMWGCGSMSRLCWWWKLRYINDVVGDWRRIAMQSPGWYWSAGYLDERNEYQGFKRDMIREPDCYRPRSIGFRLEAWEARVMEVRLVPMN